MYQDPTRALLSLAQAARATSGEHALEDLQRALLRTLQESSGASYAALLDCSEGGGWVVLCQSEGEHRPPTELPASVLHAARRTLKPVSVGDASAQAPYTEDAVVRARGLRSLLCCPLAHQGRWRGLLYLESTLAPDAFSQERQQHIEALSTLAAIALDNSHLSVQVTEQGRVQEAIRREVTAVRQYLQLLIDNSPAAIYMKDVDGRYLLVNSRFEAFYGVRREQIVGRRDMDLLPTEEARRLMEHDQRVLRTGETIQFEEDLPWRDGVHTFVSAKFPLRTEDGSIHAVCGISTDITDRKRAELALKEANERLEQRVAERTEQLHAAQQKLVDGAWHAGMVEIASGILHNLGNALNSITVSSTLLRERIQGLPVGSIGQVAKLMDRPTEELAEFLTQDEKGQYIPEFLGELHHRLSDAQQFLLRESLALGAKIEHARSVISTQQTYAKSRTALRERLRLQELADDALRLCAVGDHFDRHIQRDYGEEEPELYERHVVVQILVNLITNARNAVKERPGNTDPLITLVVQQDVSWTTAMVTDNGVGFDPSVKARLFTYGFTTRAAGHGFGLHSAAVSAQSLGGRLEAHSEGPGKGARFSLILPRGRSGTETT
jgi:PAS domain S-box-containing protein